MVNLPKIEQNPLISSEKQTNQDNVDLQNYENKMIPI